MERLLRCVVVVLAAMVVVAAARNAAHADKVNVPIPATGKAAAVHVAPVGLPLPAAHMESVLTDPRGATTERKRNTGWLLHYGTEHDSCARPDVTSGGRVMCVSW
jgi:hypothetical protein